MSRWKKLKKVMSCTAASLFYLTLCIYRTSSSRNQDHHRSHLVLSNLPQSLLDLKEEEEPTVN
jgi:hypothetical protein